MMSFCGHDSLCKTFNSFDVLQRAKANVEMAYPIVGVLEDVNKTLDLLEKKLPHIFLGASKVISMN